MARATLRVGPRQSQGGPVRVTASGAGPRANYAPPMGNQLVEVKDFPGFTVGDAIKIATHRLTQQGYRNIEPLPPLPRRAQDGLWRLSLPRGGPPRPPKGPRPPRHPLKE